jgi:Na+-driven multidrug efflux pump
VSANQSTTAPGAKALAAVAVPLFIELLLAYAVNLAALRWSAKLGTDHAAAYTVVQQLHSAAFIVFRIVAVGASVAMSQMLGAGQKDGVQALARACLYWGAAIAWVGAALIGAAAPWLVGTVDAAGATVSTLAITLLLALTPGLALDAIVACTAAIARAHLANRAVLVVIVVMHAMHGVGAAILMPEHGLIGFAWAFAASRVLALLALLALWRFKLQIALVGHAPWRALGSVWHVAVPTLGETLAYRLAQVLVISIIVASGAGYAAAHGFAMQLTQLWVMFTLGLGLACEIMVGHLVGAGRLDDVKPVIQRALNAGLALALLGSVAMAASFPLWQSALHLEASVVASVQTLLWMGVLLELGRTCNIIVINALRATGDTQFPFRIALISMTLVLAGGAWALGHVLQWGLIGVWIALVADEAARGFAMVLRLRSRAWMPHARAAQQRVLETV